MSLDWQTIHIPFGAGLDTKTDPRAVQPPALVRADNVQFDELANVSKRLPYAALPIVDQAGATITDLRRLAVVDDELLLFTETAVYSYSPAEAAWVERAEYLAVSSTEQSVFVRQTEQTLADRAEHSGIAVYAWLDASAATTVYLAARDTTTGAVVLAPTSQVNGAETTTRPRLLALDTKILFFALDSAGDLLVKSLDPTDLATGAAASWTTVAAINSYYDVCQFETDEAFVAYTLSPTTSYGYAEIQEDGTVVLSGTKVRPSSGGVAVALSANSDILVARHNGNSIRGDILTPAFADGTVDVALGTTTSGGNQITAAFDGATTATIFWSDASFDLEYNTLTAAGSAGTETGLLKTLRLGSRAFAYNGDVYVWALFGASGNADAQLQNGAFLYRADGALIAKATIATGGGYIATAGHLPNVQATSATTFACAQIERRIVEVGASLFGYAARSPREVVVTFDSDLARRAVQLGRTLYLTGAQVSQYDGDAVHEVGFPNYPFAISAIDSGVAGNLAAGTYTWTATLSWTNARGEVERSTTTAYVDAAIAANMKATVAVTAGRVTSKTSPAAALEIWRTEVDPVEDAPLYLVTSNDPSDLSGDNKYLPNNPTSTGTTSLTDDLDDDDARAGQLFPEVGSTLNSLAPPPATVIAAGRDRLFLAGIANQPYTVVYSRLRGIDEIASFHDALRIDLPPTGGAVTALALLGETMVTFQERAITALSGEGFDNAAGGSNYSPTRISSGDVGAESAEGVAQVPQGVLFKSAKGWYLLDRGLSVSYVGAPVSDYDSEAVLAIDVLESQHQIRALTASRLLVWDYLVNQWSTWTIAGARHAVMHGGVHHYCTSSGVYAQDAAWGVTEADYALDVQLAPIKFSDLVGYQKVRRIQILGEYRSAHGLRVRLARNQASSYFDDDTFTISGLTAGDTLERRHVPAIRKSRALSIRLTDVDPGGATPWGESLKLTGIALEVGTLRGTNRNLAAASKQ